MRGISWLLVFLLLALTVDALVSFEPVAPERQLQVPYSPLFLEQVEKGNVESISSKGSTVEGRLRAAIRYPADGEPSRSFETEVPSFADTEELARLLESEHVQVTARAPDTGPSLLASLLSGFLPLLLMVGLLVWLYRRAAGGPGGPLGSLGRSRARRVEPADERVTFDDIAGIDEAKEELTEIVDFLRHPGKYRRVGGRIPRGVLRTGPPGAGKTLLARALAGEADVPFFSISASEFVEVFVGVGASRVRDLFTQATSASGQPSMRPGTRWSACSPREPSRSRSAAGSRRSWCTAMSRPGPRRTSVRSPSWPATWSPAGG